MPEARIKPEVGLSGSKAKGKIKNQSRIRQDWKPEAGPKLTRIIRTNRIEQD